MKKHLFYITLFLLLFSFGSIVHADTITIDMPIAEPVVGPNSGYIVLLTQNVNTGKYYGRLHYVNTSVNYQSNYYIPFTTASVFSDQLSLRMVVGSGNVGFSQIYYQWSGTNQYGHLLYSFNYEYTWTWSNSEYVIVSYQTQGNMNVINNLSGAKIPFVINWADSKTSYNDNIDIINELGDIYNLIVELYNQDSAYYGDLLEYFNYLTGTTDGIYDLILDLTNYLSAYYPDFKKYLQSIDTELNQISGQIDDIIKLIEDYLGSYQGEENTDKLPNDSINDYNDAENNVIDKNKNPNDIQADISVNLNSGVNAYIWNLVTEVLNAHSKIFTFIISMLSLGAISLVLGRR